MGKKEVQQSCTYRDRNVPIDRGWAWMIVIASFFVHFLAVAAANKCFGVFYVEFARAFDGTSQATSWISSVAQFLALALGPIAGMISARITARVTACIGGVLVSLGFILSMFAPNLQYLYFSYGLFVGVGTALLYSPTVSVLGQYFVRRRALANGIGAAGAGVGGFLVPPLVTLVVQEYSLSGTLLIMAGLMLNLVVCGALLRPVESYRRRDTQYIINTNIETYSGKKPETENEAKPRTLVDRPRDDELELHQRQIRGDGEVNTSSRELMEGGASSGKTEEAGDTEDRSTTPGEAARKDEKSRVDTRSRGSTFEWRVIKTPLVLVYFISTLLVYSGLPVVLMFLPSLGISLGLTDSHAALLLSLQGAGDLCGRVLFGALADINFTNKRNFFILGGVVSGVAAGVMPLFPGGGLPVLGVLSALFGTGIGNVFGLLPVLVAEGLGPELLPSGYGFLTVAMGIPFLYAPALGGYLVDSTSSWTTTFVISGVIIIIGSLVPVVLEIIERREKIKDVPNVSRR